MVAASSRRRASDPASITPATLEGCRQAVSGVAPGRPAGQDLPVADQTTPATPAALGWTGAVRLPDLWDLVTDPRARVGFGKVVLAHDVPRTHPEVTDEALY